MSYKDKLNALVSTFSNAIDSGTIQHERKPFEGIARLIPNPTQGEETHVLALTADKSLYYVHPGRNNRIMFTVARDLAYDNGETQVRVDSVGNVYFSELGYEQDSDGALVTKSDEYEIAQLANYAHKAFSVVGTRDDEQFEGITLFVKQQQGRRGKSNTPARPSFFTEQYINALRSAAALGDAVKIAALTVLILEAFPQKFGGVDAEGVLTTAGPDVEAQLFRTMCRKALKGTAKPQAQQPAPQQPAETTESGDEGIDPGF